MQFSIASLGLQSNKFLSQLLFRLSIENQFDAIKVCVNARKYLDEAEKSQRKLLLNKIRIIYKRQIQREDSINQSTCKVN